MRNLTYILAAAVAALSMTRPVQAEPLGAYIGGTIGQGEVETNDQTFPVFYNPGEFKQGNGTWGVVLGIRPLPYLGAEIGHIDFGSPSGNVGTYRDQVTMRADTAFGVLYLPLHPVEIYGKFGVARMKVDVTNTDGPFYIYNCPVNGCGPVPPGPQLYATRTRTNFAYGAGVQYKFATLRAPLGSLAVHLEYERFEFGGENPSQADLGLIWTFF